MDSISNLLGARKPNEPPQIQALKNYVMNNHNVVATASVSSMGYGLTIPSAALATTLRMELPKIELECNLDKKLFIRIGHS